MSKNQLIRAGDSSAQLSGVVSLWADHVTDANSPRRFDIIRDKANAVLDFFSYVGKAPNRVTPLDVKTWQAELESKGLAPATVYARISRVSSFYNWAIAGGQAQHNPVGLARPKSPKAYQTESTKSLSDDEVMALVRVVKSKADSGEVIGKRDYAILLLYLTTGLRRREVIQLTWGDVNLKDTFLIETKVKGGEYSNIAVEDPGVKAALLDYLTVADRLDKMHANSPLWVAHDRGHHGQALTSHGFVKGLKGYATEAGLAHIHLHQTRHTFARIVSEETGSIVDTQAALGHKNAATTRVYVQRIGVKKDKYSRQITKRLGLKDE